MRLTVRRITAVDRDFSPRRCRQRIGLFARAAKTVTHRPTCALAPMPPDEGHQPDRGRGHGDAQALWRIETSGALTLANSYTYSTWGVPTTTTHNGIANLGFRYLYVGRHGVQWDDRNRPSAGT